MMGESIRGRVVALAALCVLAGCVAGCAGRGASAGPPKAAPAVMLASLQRGYTTNARDVLTQDFQRELDTMFLDCTESEARIADHTVATYTILRKHGTNESYLSILSHVRRSIPQGAAPTSCADVFAAYATLRISG